MGFYTNEILFRKGKATIHQNACQQYRILAAWHARNTPFRYDLTMTAGNVHITRHDN